MPNTEVKAEALPLREKLAHSFHRVRYNSVDKVSHLFTLSKMFCFN